MNLICSLLINIYTKSQNYYTIIFSTTFKIDYSFNKKIKKKFN